MKTEWERFLKQMCGNENRRQVLGYLANSSDNRCVNISGPSVVRASRDTANFPEASRVPIYVSLNCSPLCSVRF
ncbi:hypothetical protein J6590_023619 [Homalodisca vitripennis]|nr:hypothetical protein J6590_023619 [Homalodisca vitripennis]